MNLLQIIWDVSPVIFSLGPVSVRWYGLFWALSFYLGYEILTRVFNKEKVPIKELDKLLIYIAVGSVLGARLGHCFFYDFDYYMANPLEIFMIWQGGLASHGGAMGIVVALYYYQKKVSSKPVFWTLDRLLLVVALAAFFIRMGNLMNSEIVGKPTDAPWGFVFVRLDGLTGPARHPGQFYEAIAYLLIFVSMVWMYLKRMPRLYAGYMSAFFLIGVFTVRFFVEYVKENQSPFEEGMMLNMGQILSIPMILGGFGVLYYALKLKQKAI